MELGLSLGDTSRLKEKPCEGSNQLGLGFNTTLSIGPVITKQIDQHQQEEESPNQNHKSHTHSATEQDHEETRDESLNLTSTFPKDLDNTVFQLDLLPHTTPAVAPMNPPSNIFSWDHLSEDAGRSLRGIDVNTVPAEVAVTVAMTTDLEEAAAVSPSSNSAAAWFQLDLCIFNRGRSVSGEDGDERQMAYSKGSDEDNNGDGGGDCDDGSARKKLRLSKEQSGFLEESFKEHNTLNPKQKLALAKQLDLRPRQVEVWFQNRRARSKLKQTEVECEYMKRCCETLREENRRLEKELQELRVLKTLNPFCMHSPPTTLTMCPSCELVATNSTTTTSNASSNTVTVKTIHQPTTPQNLKGFV